MPRSLQQVDHQVEVLQLLADDLRHGAGEVVMIHVGEQQIHRRARRLLLAMGVVDQDFFEMRINLA